ncbi:hypothetical protein ACJJTC_013162 [Scirpophaga incertulas]
MPLVECTCTPTPALGLGTKILSAIDTASTVTNIGALVGLGGALLVPAVAPAAMTVAVGVGIVSGVYGIARSTANLIDRKYHEQDIGLGNTEARNTWINILVSTTGISAASAAKILSWAATTGTNVKILMNAVTIIQFTNLGTGAIGVANSLWGMISKYQTYKEPPTALEIFQFTSSALFLGIGAMSNQTAQDIVQDAQARTINDIRDSLPNKVQKKMFDKVTAETRRVKGTIQGNSDVIKALKTIDNKSDFFAKLARINKHINKNKIRISISSDSNILFNDQHSININDLYSIGKKGREQLFQEYGPAKVTSKNVPTRIYPSTSSANAKTFNEDILQCYITPEKLQQISNFILTLSRIDREYVAEVLSEISGILHNAFLFVCVELLNSIIPPQIDLFKSCLGNDYKGKIVCFVFNYIKSKIPVNEDVDISFGNVLNEYISNGKIKPNTIKKILDKLIEAAKNSKISDDPRTYEGMHNFFKRKRTSFIIPKAGEVITLGKHDILVKSNTVDNLEEWLEIFSQQQCDVFMSLCYKIISNLSHSEVNEMNEVNFDEDIILKVVKYILEEKMVDVCHLILSNCHDEILCDDVVSLLKTDMLHWRRTQDIRKYKSCNKCQCVLYI